MRTLITGVAGFIGSRLAAGLLDAGHEVTGVDAFTPYYDPTQKRTNLEPLLHRRGFRFEELDLRHAPLQPLASVDVVFHLAGQPGVRSSWGRSFSDYVGHNVLATQRLLEACRAAGTPRFVLASSSSVYGEAECHPTAEDVQPRPVSPYGVTKLAGEHLLDAYASNFGFHGVALRYFTVYGPGQRPDMAFHRFIRALLEGGTIHLFGNGEQTRDVTYVDDVVAATMAAGEADKSGVLTVNVGGGSQVSVNRVLEILAHLTGSESEVVREAPMRGDVRHTSADLSRARDLLGYGPRVGIEDGLCREVEWLRQRITS